MNDKGVRLHLGCGQITPPGWINVDGSWNARLARYPKLRWALVRGRIISRRTGEVAWAASVCYHDLRKPLPLVDGTATAVYASHLLEHLYETHARVLMRECFRVLKPGGVIRIVVPDLKAAIYEYLGNARLDPDGEDLSYMAPGDRLNRRLLLRNPAPPAGSLIYRMYSLTQDFHSHKWMYDADSLIVRFRDAGFLDACEMPFRQSRIEDIASLELPERVLNGAGICVEATRPHGA